MLFKKSFPAFSLRRASPVLAVAALLLGACSPVATPPTLAAAQLPVAPQPTATFTVVPPTAVPAPEATMPPVTLVDIKAPSLENNLVGERTKRSLFVYVPPSYNTSTKRYPVIYYLPGFTDSLMIGFNLPTDADRLFNAGTVQDLIIVVASGTNEFGGSFYVNSPLTGNWEDFIVKDVVGYVDSHYRTLPQAQSRGITGHSMGGFGALNIAMHHPEVFGAVYSMSPGLFDENGLAESQMFSYQGAIDSFFNFSEQAAGVKPEKLKSLPLGSGGFTVAYGLAFAPNPDQAPYIDYPYTTVNGQLVRDETIWNKWDSGFGGIPDEVKQYKQNLLQLKGITVDYGTFDSYAWIPKGCEYYSAQLTAAGIPHQLLTYEGSHESGVGARISEHMLPFFSELLVFDTSD